MTRTAEYAKPSARVRKSMPSCQTGRAQGGEGIDPESVVRLREVDAHHDGRKQLDEVGVELAAGLGADLRDRVLDRSALAVRPVVDDRVERVDQPDDAGPDRDRVALEPVRVASAVPALVMVADDRGELAGAREGLQICSPMIGWRRISIHSSSVSGSGLLEDQRPTRRSCRCRAGAPRRRCP